MKKHCQSEASDYSSKTNKSKMSFMKKLILFTLFNLLFSLITGPFIVFYGPFENVKQSVIGIFVTSTNYEYVAKLFLSTKDIKEIMSDIQAVDPTKSGEEIEKLSFSEDKEDKIDLYNIEGDGFVGKMLIISNPMSVKVGYSSQLGSIGETTSTIARRNDAVAAINGGGFSDYKWTGTGGIPLGFIISEGKMIFDDIKDEDEKRDTIGISDEGMLIVGSHTMEEIKKYNIREGVTFGPPLVVNGEPTIKSGDGGWGIAPRAAIAQTYDGSIVFLVIDGRSIGSIGATLKDVQDILLKYDVVNAANLDGGSSTTLYFNNRVVNTPSDSLGERTIPSVFMVIPSGEDKE
ncbi:MAG: phosphodiester glycosidase family protein [Clostridiales bacterium]